MDAVDETYYLRHIGESVTFSVTVSGAQGYLLYQWFKFNEAKSWAHLIGEESDALAITNITVNDAGTYKCEVTDLDTFDTAWSPIFTLEVELGLPSGTSLLALSAIVLALFIVGLRKRN